MKEKALRKKIPFLHLFLSTNSVSMELITRVGSLSGDELVPQVKQVIVGYEMIGVKILGLLFDGGAGNAWYTTLFCLAINNSDGAGNDCWLKEQLCLFPNPANPSRRIAIMTCSTHNGKGGRNFILHSNTAEENEEQNATCSTRDFVNNGIHFGWVTIKRTCICDKRRGVPCTPLTDESVSPDRYNKMLAGLVKHVFIVTC